MIGELIMRCFHARTAAHVLHLSTRSYATHKALNKFYDKIIDLTDALAEAYIGDYGLIGDFPSKYITYEDPISLMTDLSEFIEKNRYKVCDKDDTYLQNAIDEIMALVRSTQYKLKCLR